MGELNISQTTYGNMTNNVKDVTVDLKNTDGITGNETVWINSKWSQYWGYFNSIAELKSAMIMKSIWNVGKGLIADPETTVILDHVSGWGKDTFEDILFNMDLISRVAGDSFAEIIRDSSTGILINLKPLDPGCIKIVVNDKGIIQRYEQTAKYSKNQILNNFKPDEIFHLSHNRLADQIHGISDIEGMEQIILAENESFTDMRKIMHRQAKPLIMFKLGTDNQAKIDAFVLKMDQAVNKGENIYIPDDKNAVSYEVVQINISQIIMEWRNDIKNKYYRTMGLPQIVFGSSGTTESGGKIEYLAHEQIFEKDQKFLENQVWNQLYLRINLIPPVSLLENLQTDASKDGATQQMNMQQSDITAGAGK